MRGDRRVQLGGDQQARGADLAHDRHLRERRGQASADVLHVRQQPVALDHTDGRQGRGGRDRVPAERRAVLPRAEKACCPFGEREHGTDGNAAAQALGESDGVGQDPATQLGVLEREPVPGATDAGLHLVHDQQCARLVGESARERQVARGQPAHPGLALHELDHERGDVVGQRGLERVRVTERQERHVPRQRLERRAVGGLRGERQSAHGAAVERALEREHPCASGSPGHLERGLVRLRP